jgi:UDP:flavonoid glycosyltransferase YjiC (YdhE family)
MCHVARPLVLAEAVDLDSYEVHFATAKHQQHLLRDLPYTAHVVDSRPSQEFLDRLAAGKPLFSAETLRRYVKEDLALLEEIKPDLVVGDLRLSLAVSAPLTRTPYATITSAYWSPYARQNYVLPDLPLSRLLGATLATPLFKITRPLAFAWHCRPLNRVRKEFGLPSLGNNLLRIYTAADVVLYADVPEMVRMVHLPPDHHYLGPLLWSFPAPLPSWWRDVNPDRPAIFVSLGSSGQANLIPVVLEALRDFPVSLLVSTSGRFKPEKVPDNAFVADYLPGEEASSRARLVICNGGSPTTHRALASNAPVLGIACNMDQYLNMEAIQSVGAGELLRSDHANVKTIRAAVKRLLEEKAFAQAAAEIATLFGTYSAPERFRSILTEMLGPVSSPRPNHKVGPGM